MELYIFMLSKFYFKIALQKHIISIRIMKKQKKKLFSFFLSFQPTIDLILSIHFRLQQLIGNKRVSFEFSSVLSLCLFLPCHLAHPLQGAPYLMPLFILCQLIISIFPDYPSTLFLALFLPHNAAISTPQIMMPKWPIIIIVNDLFMLHLVGCV